MKLRIENTVEWSIIITSATGACCIPMVCLTDNAPTCGVLQHEEPIRQGIEKNSEIKVTSTAHFFPLYHRIHVYEVLNEDVSLDRESFRQKSPR